MDEALRERLLRLIKKTVRRGRVRLSSGAYSDFYIDMRLLTLTPAGAYLVAEVFAAMTDNLDYQAVGGMTMGADPIVGAVCYSAHLKDRPLRGFIIRKSAKGHGLQKRIEGPELTAGTKVILVDDVVTSGGSLLQAYDAVRQRRAEVVAAWAVVDRQEGAAAALAAKAINFKAAFTRAEIEAG